MRGVTNDIDVDRENPDISTHTPHARRDSVGVVNTDNQWISTHTPHARRDNIVTAKETNNYNFNSHASCEA